MAHTEDMNNNELIATARQHLATAIERGDEPDTNLAENGWEGLGIEAGVPFWRDNVGELEILAFANGTARIHSFGDLLHEEA